MHSEGQLKSRSHNKSKDCMYIYCVYPAMSKSKKNTAKFYEKEQKQASF